MWTRLVAAFVIGTVVTSLFLAWAVAAKIWREAGADATSAEERAEVRSQIAISVILGTIMTFPIAILGGLVIALTVWCVIWVSNR